MPATASQTRILTVRKGELRFDVAVTAGTPLSNSLSAMGMHVFDPSVAVVDTAGKAIDVAEPPSDSLSDGDVIAIIEQARAEKMTAAEEASAGPEQTSFPVLWTLALAFPAVAIMLAMLANLAITDPLSPTTRYIGTAALSIMAFVAILSATSETPLTRISGIPLLTIVLVSFAAGFFLAPNNIAAASALAVMMGLFTLTLACALIYVRARGTLMGRTAGMLLLISIAVTLIWAAPFFVEFPLSMPCAILAGASAPALRAIPSFCLDVPDSQLVDMESNASQRWTVRGVRPGKPRPIGTRAVTGTILAAEHQSNLGTMIFTAVPLVTMPVVFVSATPNTFPWWAMIALTMCLLLTFTYLPRSSRSHPARHAPRIAASILLLEFVWICGPDLSTILTWSLIAFVLVTAFILIGVSVPVSRGVKSLGLSRASDTLQALGTALALPCGILAANFFDSIRGLLGS